MTANKGQVCPNHPHRPARCRGLCGSCYDRVYREENPEFKKRKNAYHRRYNNVHRKHRHAQNRRLHLKRNFNTTVEEYEAHVEEQDGLCAICKKRPVNQRLAIDHEWSTGRKRGLLCNKCNTQLGWFEKYKDAIQEYLVKTWQWDIPLARMGKIG